MFFSIFSLVKPSLGSAKAETIGELTQKLNKATKQLHDPLFSKEDCQHLADLINDYANHISKHAMMHNTVAGQPDADPDLDDPANSVMETP